jgi:hypothetical protein
MDTVNILLRMPREDILFLNGLLETYDDLTVTKTLDPSSGLVVLMTSPGREGTVRSILESLAGEVGLEILDPADPAVVPFLDKIHALA